MSRRFLLHMHVYWRRYTHRTNGLIGKIRQISSSCKHRDLDKFSTLPFQTLTLNTDQISRVELEDDNDASVRSIIQFDSCDPVINALMACTTVQDVFDITNEHSSNLKKEHQVQAVLVLWYLQNVFARVQTQLGKITDFTETDYVTELKKQVEFQKFLDKITVSAKDYNIDELTCTFLYLSKMDVDQRSNPIQALLLEIEKRFREDPSCATLTALSRSSVAFKYNNELWCNYFLLGIVPFVESKIDEISSPLDLRLLTICLMHLYYLVSPSALKKYKNLCQRFAEERILTDEHGRTIVKALTFLSLSFWANHNVEIVRQLGKLLEGHVKKLNIKDVIALNKSLHTHLEPAGLLEEVNLVAREYLRSDNLLPDKDINVGVLCAIARLSSFTEKRQVESLLYKELESDYFLGNMISQFQILRSLKTSDHKLCHLFWSKTMEALQTHAVERDPIRLLRVAHRYMYFNNNMGGTYRHYAFEKAVLSWILDEIRLGVSSCMPSRLARCVSFILAYSNEPAVVIDSVDRLMTVAPQLSKIDCAMLSRGVEIMLELTRRRQIHSDVMQKLVELDTCMNECAWRHLEENDLSMSSINTLLRTFHNRRVSPDSLLFHTIIQRLKQTKESLNSRLIRDISFCLSGLSYLIPSLMDKMAAYVVDNEDTIMTETAERVLTTAFCLGYPPEAGNDFFIACARLLIRDKDRLPCLSIIQISLALSYFHAFPPELVNFVFAVSFLERIDRELAASYSRATYPVRVRFALMELNRSVCLDQPELDIPWFHAKYCEEISSLDPAIATNFHKDVWKQLTTVLGSDKLLQTGVYSLYGYKINFLIYLDAMTKPLIKSQAENAKEKLAIILHSDQQYTAGDRRLKGQQQLRQRHLEMLGYRVIPIAEHVWNAMYLTEPHAKRTFLADQIWPER